ncbi:MAG: hypothetical protein ABEJ91_04340 [Candidatus Nanohaloarchaea archaeon]
MIAGAGIFFYDGGSVISGFFNKGLVSPITGFAIIFVAYEGFQLLCYDYTDIRDVEVNLKRGMYASILIAIGIYLSVSFMATLRLTPAMLAQHKEYALAGCQALPRASWIRSGGDGGGPEHSLWYQRDAVRLLDARP